MAKCGKCNFNDLKKFQAKLNKFREDEIKVFIEGCAKELAKRLLTKVVKRTPVGDYSKEIVVVAKRNSKKHKKGDEYTKRVKNATGKSGGTLRRGWTAEKNSNVADYAQSLSVKHIGNTYVIEIVNPVEYASYVEFGHRYSNHAGWARGKFMLTISQQEVEATAPAILEALLMRKLGECFK